MPPSAFQFVLGELGTVWSRLSSYVVDLPAAIRA